MSLFSVLTAIGNIAGAVKAFFAWLGIIQAKKAGKDEARVEAIETRDKQEAEAKAAGEEARKDHAMNDNDSAFDQEFKRD